MLLDRINSPFVRANSTVLQALMRLIPFLAFGDHEKMHALVSHFMPYLDFDKFVFHTLTTTTASLFTFMSFLFDFR